MADGPRCKRRKQANPKRSSVTDFNNGLEASSDSDDEDKLHIVEEDSLQDTDAAKHDGTAAPDGQDAPDAVLPHNGPVNGVKEECVSEEEGEEAQRKDSLVEEILQQKDTAVIYPEAPDDEQSPAETTANDENGTPDSFSALHTCPYCSRGYKRNASLKEHIKYRHETSEDNYSCSHCSYTFTYRSQLERHMSHHRGDRERYNASLPVSGNRKFKCTECSKAFKYKHHLKEHLRIHSGEKPYECSNCKKRFSHSGSYSSHISSKKCRGVSPPPDGKAQPLTTTTTAAPPLVIAPAGKANESKPLQEQIPVTQIKAEPVEYECKQPGVSVNGGGVAQTVTTTTATSAAAVPAQAAQALPPGQVAMVVPTVGLMSPVSINLSDLQNVLKVAMDGNVLRQVLGSANGVVTQGKTGLVVQQPQQQIISLPAFVDHDGTTKIIINYSISPANNNNTTSQPMSLIAKNSPVIPLTTTSHAAAAPTQSKTDKPQSPIPEAADLSIVKTEPESIAITETEQITQAEIKNATSSVAQKAAPKPKYSSPSSCLLCDECPDHLEALHLLQHRKAANGEAVDSAALDPSFADLLSEAGVTLEEPSSDDLLTLLKNYFASNTDPSEDELAKIAGDVRIPVEVVGRWFDKMNSGKKRENAPVAAKKVGSSEDVSKQNGEAEEETSESGIASPSSPLSQNTGDLVIIKREPEDADAAPADSQAEPLDLSLPKDIAEALASKMSKPLNKQQQEQPLNLTCLRKDQLEGRTIFVTTSPQTGGGVNIVTATQLPTLLAIASQGTVSCLGTKRTILIPQLTYTYNSQQGAETVLLNGHKETEKRKDSSPDIVSSVEDQSEADSASQMKKRRLENGVYPCDLCSKVFQKGSSLLRHKYEHTGKRPHECNVCKKAFKHKHHLIEHSRLHSGEKPYQCDKCGKRFSHSGSYSQHMNHRYSYCKKDGPDGGSSNHPRSETHASDSRTTTPASVLDSDERDSEEFEEEEEEDEDDEAMCMDDIRVVQVDDGECEIYEGNFEDDEEEDEEGEERGEEVEVEGEERKEEEENKMEDVRGEGEGEREEAEEENKMEDVQEEAEEKETENDCEAETDRSIRDETDSGQPATEEVETNTE